MNTKKNEYMATVAEILEIEKERSESSSWNVIHLFKEGSFYRAYEWSAWLISVVVFNDEVRNWTQDRKPLTVTRKQDKNGDGTFVFVGFPLNSINKYIPYSIEFKPISDGQIDVYIELSEEEGNVSYDAIMGRINEWKESMPIKEEKPKKNKNGSPAIPFAQDRTTSITGVMLQIISFPIEQRSPMEAVSFLSDVRNQLIRLF